MDKELRLIHKMNEEAEKEVWTDLQFAQEVQKKATKRFARLSFSAYFFSICAVGAFMLKGTFVGLFLCVVSAGLAYWFWRLMKKGK